MSDNLVDVLAARDLRRVRSRCRRHTFCSRSLGTVQEGTEETLLVSRIGCRIILLVESNGRARKGAELLRDRTCQRGGGRRQENTGGGGRRGSRADTAAERSAEEKGASRSAARHLSVLNEAYDGQEVRRRRRMG